MKRVITILVLILFAVLISGCGEYATSGDYELGRDETVPGNLIVTAGQARLGEGSRVNGSVFVTSGSLRVLDDAEIKGSVISTAGDVTLGPNTLVRGSIFNTAGDVHMEQNAVVRGDVSTTAGNVTRAEGARVEGRIRTNGLDIDFDLFGSLCIAPLVLLAVVLFWLVSQTRRRPATEERTRSTSGLVVGGVLILIGVVVLLQNLLDWELPNWWALFFLLPAVSALARAWDSYRTEMRLSAAVRGPLVSGLALVLVAVIFLFGLSWGTWWPVFVIIFGVGILVAH